MSPENGVRCLPRAIRQGAFNMQAQCQPLRNQLWRALQNQYPSRLFCISRHLANSFNLRVMNASVAERQRIVNCECAPRPLLWLIGHNESLEVPD
ncbi:hypothetical protein KCP69_25645 [Salmonella enterica subsp. enterica]|nr:hypothetical protein KCP69_25645 [Salmonella enterica subsp. enterica]